MIRIICWTTTVLVLTTLGTFAQAKTAFPEKLLDRRFLERQDWSANHDLSNLVKYWPDYTADQTAGRGFGDKRILKQLQFGFLRAKINAEYREFKESHRIEIILMGSDFDRSFCSSFSNMVIERIGRPHLIIDKTRNMSSGNFGFLDISMDWEINYTRIHFACSGSKVYDSFIPILMILQFGNVDKIKALENLIYIECATHMSYVGSLSSKGSVEKPPLDFVLDPNLGKILKRGYQYFLDTTEFDDNHIVAKKEEKDVNSVFYLDRIAGTYKWQLRLTADSNSGSDMWGECRRISPEKKF